MDKRLHTIDSIPASALKQAGLVWLATGENQDYIARDFVRLSAQELQPLKDAAAQLYPLMLRAAKEVAARNRWSEVGIPPKAVPLLRYSLDRELDQHLVCRFDFAGGLDGMPIKLLELNADTCSLMPETAIVQELHRELFAHRLPMGRPFNRLRESLGERLRHILRQNPGRSSTLLLSCLGYNEDWLNMNVVTKAAQAAGFEDVQEMLMEKVIFSPDEGIFIEPRRDEFLRFDFWFKFVPWELVVFEEPDLLEILDSLVRSGQGVVLNPAFTLLLQSKGLMKIMYELEPGNPYLLRTSLTDQDFYDKRYVRKPMFGRMGENIAYFDGSWVAEHETQGDYARYPPVYQELALFNTDRNEYRYQPSVFWTGEPSALCFRRHDELILDDDAEFVGHVVG